MNNCLKMKMGIVAKDVQKKDVVLMIMGLMGKKWRYGHGACETDLLLIMIASAIKISIIKIG